MLLCGCQVTEAQDLLCFYFPRPKRDWLPFVARLSGRHTLLGCAPLRHFAPGSLSQRPNLQEINSPGSHGRRVVPWGEVSSWVKGAELSFSLTT